MQAPGLINCYCVTQPGAKAGKQTTTFSDNAPSWEALQQLVEEKGRQLNWQQPDLENVCPTIYVFP